VPRGKALNYIGRCGSAVAGFDVLSMGLGSVDLSTSRSFMSRNGARLTQVSVELKLVAATAAYVPGEEPIAVPGHDAFAGVPTT
jgi:hypothetical protein